MSNPQKTEQKDMKDITEEKNSSFTKANLKSYGQQEDGAKRMRISFTSVSLARIPQLEKHNIWPEHGETLYTGLRGQPL